MSAAGSADERADLGEITFGVVLAQVYGQVRDPARMRLVVAERAGAERAAHPQHDLGGGRFDERAHPKGPQRAAAPAVVGVGVDFTGRRVERQLRGPQGDVDGAEMGQGVRADIAPGRGDQKGPAHAPRPAVPAGGHPRPAVRETGPVDVAAGPAHRLGRDAGKADVERVAARHAGGGPAARDGRPGPAC